MSDIGLDLMSAAVGSWADSGWQAAGLRRLPR
jgi:hypothetical protein